MFINEIFDTKNINSILKELNINKKFVNRIYLSKNAVGIDLNENLKVENKFINVYVNKKSKYNPKKHTLIYESIIDPEKKELDPKVWDGLKLKPEIKRSIFSGIKKIISETVLEKSHISNVLLLGSLTTYNYTDTSDIDINVSVSMDEDSFNELKDIVKKYNGINAPDTLHPINYYFRNEPIDLLERAAYDLFEDKWITKPKRSIPISNFNDIVDQAISWCRKIDLDYGELKRDTLEYFMYKYLYDKNDVSSDESDSLDVKLNQIKTDLDILKQNLSSIKELRSKAYEEDEDNQLITGAETDNPDYDTKNIIKKII
jgi:predicted nucleotidyltransferase